MSKAKLACKCKSISESVLGDGCDICNPEMAKDVAYERIAELEHQREAWKERAMSERDKNKDLEQQLALADKLLGEYSQFKHVKGSIETLHESYLALKKQDNG